MLFNFVTAILAVLPPSIDILKLSSKNLHRLSTSAIVSFVKQTGLFPCLIRISLTSELVISRLSQRGAFFELGIRLRGFNGFKFCCLTFYCTFVSLFFRAGLNINRLKTSFCLCECLLCSKNFKSSNFFIGKFTRGESSFSLPNVSF